MPCGGLGRGTICKHDCINLLIPIILVCICDLLEGTNERLIEPLHQAIGLGVVSTAHAVLGSSVSQEGAHELIIKLLTLISNETLGESESKMNKDTTNPISPNFILLSGFLRHMN